MGLSGCFVHGESATREIVDKDKSAEGERDHCSAVIVPRPPRDGDTPRGDNNHFVSEGQILLERRFWIMCLIKTSVPFVVHV